MRIIGHYLHKAASVEEPDARAPEVARRVTDLICERMPSLVVEHIGSTAVPSCAGKGIIDLMVLYPEGQLEATRNVIDSLGFQRQEFGDPFPEERPMRVGSIRHSGTAFRVNVHVIAASSPEVSDLLDFRDRLRENPALIAEYVARKQELVSSGIVESPDYARHKGSFIRSVLEKHRKHRAGSSGGPESQRVSS